MKAIVLEGVGLTLSIKDIETPALLPDEVLVKIKAAALNRRDYWITIGKYAGIKYPSILGSDGSGIVVEAFSESDKHWLNKEVIINPSHNWGDNSAFQSKEFRILGLPENGTFAEFVKVKAIYLHQKPAHLSWEQAAALPLAGLTAYRALFTKAGLKSGDTVLISGVGSGTGTLALQFAVAAGCRVFVTSGTEEKLNKAIAMGAEAGVNYKNTDWAEILKNYSGGFDIIIDSALGEGFAKFPDLCKSGGRIVFFGGTAGNLPEINGRKIFWNQLQILGTTMGTAEEFAAMLKFVNVHKIVPIIDQVFSMEEADKAVKTMEKSSQFGKIVLVNQ